MIFFLAIKNPPKEIRNDEAKTVRQCPHCLELYNIPEEDKQKHWDEVANAPVVELERIMRCVRCNRKQYFGYGYEYSRNADRMIRKGPHKLYFDDETGDITCINCASILGSHQYPWDEVPAALFVDPEEHTAEERAKRPHKQQGRLDYDNYGEW